MQKFRNKIGYDLIETLKAPEAHFVENRYRTIRHTLKSRYKAIIEGLDKEVALSLIKDIIYLDRQLRLLTEGEQKELKQTLSKEYQSKELGYGIQQN